MRRAGTRSECVARALRLPRGPSLWRIGSPRWEASRSNMKKRRDIIVHIAASADGYIARPDGDLDWLTSRPAPEGFYGMNAFMKTVDTMVMGRKTYEVSLRLGAKFDSTSKTIVF